MAWDKVWEWFLPDNFADLASISGIVITLIGFVIAVKNIRRSREAADRAADAASEAVRELRLFDAVTNFNKAISMLEELRKLHRNSDWPTALEKYPEIRKVLISLRTDTPNLSAPHMTIIQTATQNMASFEKQVGRSRGPRSVLPKADKLNELISRDVDGMLEILLSLKDQGMRDQA